jgi:L-seryl-tRNA(Ser) seleniumtransferase
MDAPEMSHAQVVEIARTAIDLARARLKDNDSVDPRALAEELLAASRARRQHEVINATGVLLHTNLGRAPLAQHAVEAASLAASAYTNTEFDLLTGERGHRGANTTELLKLLTGAEDALVVNNNAAAVLLALTAIAETRGVPVSRSELVEIGGSYRLPDVMGSSGAGLIEVGTTNKTKLSDYETALQIHDCAMVLKVHQANFEIQGFTASVGVDELARLCRARYVPLVYDVCSGLLDSETPWLPRRPSWLGDEPGIRQALGAGADLALFSGDKLLGGPQAGIVVGDARLISMMRAHPLRRALRVDSATDAALAATLDSYARNAAGREIPFWKMVSVSWDELNERSELVASRIGASVEEGISMVGAGSAPGARIASPVIRLPGGQHLFARLLSGPVPVVARRDRGDLLIDLRAVDPSSDETTAQAILKCL